MPSTIPDPRAPLKRYREQDIGYSEKNYGVEYV